MKSVTSTTCFLLGGIIVLLFAADHLPKTLSDTNVGAPCPSKCDCNANSKIVVCKKRGLNKIPEEIPADSLRVNLEGNAFASPILKRANVSRFSNIEELVLSHCSIESIDADTFKDLSNIKWLDLSNNRISIIQSNTFSGLQLEHLFLGGNSDLQLNPDSFRGLSVTSLYLSECSLKELKLEVFLPIKPSLRRLFLSSNEITKLDEGLKTLFSVLVTLKLDDNPLHCDCNLAWFKKLVDLNPTLFLNSPPSCQSPARLEGKIIRELQTWDFHCIGPQFLNSLM